jgi:hypothetical protein
VVEGVERIEEDVRCRKRITTVVGQTGPPSLPITPVLSLKSNFTVAHFILIVRCFPRGFSSRYLGRTIHMTLGLREPRPCLGCHFQYLGTKIDIMASSRRSPPVLLLQVKTFLDLSF